MNVILFGTVRQIDKLLITVRRIAECPILKCMLLPWGRGERRGPECKKVMASIFFFWGGGVVIVIVVIVLLAKKEAKGQVLKVQETG